MYYKGISMGIDSISNGNETFTPQKLRCSNFQEEVVNLSKYGIDSTKVNLASQPDRDTFVNFKGNDQTEKKKDMHKIDAVNNRWGGSTYEGYKELLEKHPDKFKETYPDLYEHLTNKEIQITCSKVSEYAQTSIGEFVAETYRKLIAGDKLPEDVMALYKKYNGPMPNMI